MNNKPQSQKNTPAREELSGRLLESVDAVLQEPLAAEDLANVLERARRIDRMASPSSDVNSPVSSTTPLSTLSTLSSVTLSSTAAKASDKSRRSRWIRRVLSIAAAAALLAISLLLPRGSHPIESVAWADVVKAVAQKPWLHYISTREDGSKDETWFSVSRHVAAVKTLAIGEKMRAIGFTNSQRWIDRATNLCNEYDKGENAILQTSWIPVRNNDADPFQIIFEAFLSGNLGQNINAGQFQLIHQGQRVVEENGKQLIEQRFKLHTNIGLEEVAQQEWVIFVDSSSRLPVRWEDIVRSVADPSKISTTRSEIDYPENGPEDMYAFLGVPRTTKIIDRTVHSDVEQLVRATIDSKYWADTKFSVLVIESTEESPLGACRVWKNGLQLRVDDGMMGGTFVYEHKTQPKDVDIAQWWRREVQKMPFRPRALCDGKWCWGFEFKGWHIATKDEIASGWPHDVQIYTSIEKTKQPGPVDKEEGLWLNDPLCYLGHPTNPSGGVPFGLGIYPGHEMSVDMKPKSGPPNTVLLEVRDLKWKMNESAPWARPQTWRMWIDPTQDHLLMRYEGSIPKNGQDTLIDGYAIEELTKDPQGRLYPTVVRRFKCVNPMAGDNAKDQILRFYYDFTSDVPESLFNADALEIRPDAKKEPEAAK
jgi:hypothetical protein